jgi:hypothetical protein
MSFHFAILLIFSIFTRIHGVFISRTFAIDLSLQLTTASNGDGFYSVIRRGPTEAIVHISDLTSALNSQVQFPLMSNLKIAPTDRLHIDIYRSDETLAHSVAVRSLAFFNFIFHFCLEI